MPFFSVREPKGRFVVNITDAQHWGRKEIAANANLIAAAPDLLASLETLLADMEAEYRDRNGDADHDGIAKARAAIKKARGEK